MSTQARASIVTEPPLSPASYRELWTGIDGFRLASSTVTVTLLEDATRARFEYECHLESVGPEAARYWIYHLPAGMPEVCDIRAWDVRGRLLPRVCDGEDAPGSRLEVRLRDEVAAGARYSFWFGYETAIRPIVAGVGRQRIVSYADWVIFNIPCARLDVHVELPHGAEPVAAIPACAEDEGWRVSYRVRALRPLEAVSFVVAYRRARRPVMRRPPSMVAAGGYMGSGLGPSPRA